MRGSRLGLLAAFLGGLALGGGAWLLRAPQVGDERDGPALSTEAPSPPVRLDPAVPGSRSSRRVPGTLGAKVRTLLAGRVLDPDGAPVAGALLDVAGPDALGAVRSDATGHFVLPLRGTRSHVVVRVRAEGFAERRSPELEAGNTDVRLVLEPGRSISGQVLDPDGRPAQGALVRVGDSPRTAEPTKTLAGSTIDTSRFDGVGAATTGPDGRFLLHDLAPAEHVLFATARGHARSEPVSAHAPAAGVVLRLQPGHVLELHVRDLSGRPIAGAWVTSEETDPPYPTVAGLTDDTGLLRVDGLPPVRRTLGVMAAGHARALREDVQFGGPPITIVLEPEHRIRLRITGLDGKPALPDVRVMDLGWGHVWHELRAADDGIEIAGLGEGPYRIVLEAPGVARTVLNGVGHRDSPIAVALKPGFSIRGTLPLADAGEYVYAVPRGATPSAPSRHPLREWVRPALVESGAKTFEISGLDDALYDLLVVVGRAVESGSEAPPALGGAVVPGVRPGDAGLAIVLPKGESIAGTVRRSGVAVRNLVEVQAYDGRGLCRAYAWPKAEKGAFALHGLPPGPYRIVAWLEDGMVILDDVAAPSEGLVVEVP